jgi:hypothetical protein
MYVTLRLTTSSPELGTPHPAVSSAVSSDVHSRTQHPTTTARPTWAQHRGSALGTSDSESSLLNLSRPISTTVRRPRRSVSYITLCLALALGTLGLAATPADAMRRVRAPYPGFGKAPGMEAAIRATWPASLQRQALNVAWCESRGRASAHNGQYKGHFQMGRKEWAKWGKGGNPYNGFHNAAAAYRYYRAAGWGPWECRP